MQYTNSQRKKDAALMHNAAYLMGEVLPSFTPVPKKPVFGSGNQMRILKHAVKRARAEHKLEKEANSPRQHQLNSGYAKIMWLMTLPFVTELP